MANSESHVYTRGPSASIQISSPTRRPKLEPASPRVHRGMIRSARGHRPRDQPLSCGEQSIGVNNNKLRAPPALLRGLLDSRCSWHLSSRARLPPWSCSTRTTRMTQSSSPGELRRVGWRSVLADSTLICGGAKPSAHEVRWVGCSEGSLRRWLSPCRERLPGDDFLVRSLGCFLKFGPMNDEFDCSRFNCICLNLKNHRTFSPTYYSFDYRRKYIRDFVSTITTCLHLPYLYVFKEIAFHTPM